MATCATCQHDYDGSFRVTTADGRELDFDSIECAATQIAPVCGRCGCRVLGHGVHRGAATYCCDHCAAAGAA